MIIVYRPEDGEELRWDRKEIKLTSVEVEFIERNTGLAWGELQGELAKGRMLAMRGLAWAYLKRSQPTLRFADFVPGEDELDLDMDSAERAEARREVEASTDLSDAEKAAAFAMLAEPDDAQGEELPKASAGTASPTSEPATGGSSPTSSTSRRKPSTG